MRFAAVLAISGGVASAFGVSACSAILDTASLVGGGGSEPSGVGAQSGAMASGGSGVVSAGSSPSGGTLNAAGGTSGGGTNASGASAGGVSAGGKSAGGATSAAGTNAGGAGTGGASGGGASGGGAGGSAPTCHGVCDGSDSGCCPSGCTGFRAHGIGYMACGTLETWNNAEIQCLEQEMQLAQIDSDTENGSLATELEALGLGAWLWIGGESEQNANQTLEWLDGTVIAKNGTPSSTVYQDFASGQPTTLTSENCVQISGANDSSAGTWANALCTVRQGFLCKSIIE